MNRWISTRAVVTYVIILAAILVISSLADKYVRETSRELFDVLLIAASMIAVLIAMGIVVPRLEGRRSNRPRPTEDAVAEQLTATRPWPTSCRREWTVVTVSIVLAFGVWAVLIYMEHVIDDLGVKAMALFQIPFVSAVITTVAILALGPVHRRQELRPLADWIPLGVLLVVALAGVFLIPALALWAFGYPDYSLYAENVLPGFLILPLTAAIVRIYRSLR